MWSFNQHIIPLWRRSTVSGGWTTHSAYARAGGASVVDEVEALSVEDGR